MLHVLLIKKLNFIPYLHHYQTGKYYINSSCASIHEETGLTAAAHVSYLFHLHYSATQILVSAESDPSTALLLLIQHGEYRGKKELLGLQGKGEVKAYWNLLGQEACLIM